MPYTLMMFLLWGVAFFVIGLLVGWMLRSLRARRNTSAGVAESTPGDEPQQSPT